MLPKKERLERKLFPALLKSRQFRNSPHFTLRSVSDNGPARFAVSVSKKVSKSAVVRNRIRRRAYSSLPKVNAGLYLIVAKTGADKIKGEELRTELAMLFKKG